MPAPTIYTDDLAALICDRLADGQSLREVCRSDDMPSRETVRAWLRSNEAFRARYDQALIERADAHLEEILDIADDASNDYMDRRRADGTIDRVPDPEQVARSKLRLHARQWAMAKMRPRKYGDKITHAGDPDAPLIPAGPDDLARRLAFLFTKADHEMRQAQSLKDEADGRVST